MGETTNQKVGWILGIVYIVIGIAGFLVTGVDDFMTTNSDEALVGFELNPLHNIVHLAVGLALLLAARSSAASSRTMNTLVGAVYLLVGIVGFFIIDSEANILSLNSADNLLHLASALVLLVVGLRREPSAA